jgi:CubicO group peptidase (beta-lactamase class C family)
MARRFLPAGIAAVFAFGAIAQTTPFASPPPPATAPKVTMAEPPAVFPLSSSGEREGVDPATNPQRHAPAKSPRPLPPAAPPDQGLPKAQLEAFVDGVVREAMAERHIAGVAVSVVQDGQIVLAKGYGVAKVAPRRPVDAGRTLFRLGDISQSLTWIVVLREAGAGHLRLDGPVNLYLPEALRIPDHGGFRPIRIEDILAGESGFDDRALGQAFERDVALVRPLQTYLREERPRRVREPGSLVGRTEYGAALVGAAAAETAGKPFETLIEQDVTGPLGLSHTSFREPRPDRAGLPAPMAPAIADGISDGFRWSASGLRLRPFEFAGQRAPSGSASASAVDMGRFMAMLLADGSLDGVRVLDPAQAARLKGSLFVKSALPDGVRGLEMDGQTLSFRSRMTLAPAMRLGVFIAANTDSGALLVHDLAGRIVEQFNGGARPPPPAVGAGLLAAKDDLDGPWLDDRRAFGGLEGFVDRFRKLAWARVLDDRRLLLSTPSGATRWVVEAGDPPLRLRSEDGEGELVFAAGEPPATFFPPSGNDAYQRPGLADRPEVFIAAAILTLLLSLFVLADFPVRLRQTFRESQGQRRAAVVQATQAALWLAAAGLMAVFAWQGRDPAALMYGWPGIPLVVASSCALVATALFIPLVLLMPPVWRGGRRVESWSAPRKLAFTVTTLVFLAFAVLLGIGGALQPWSA